MRLYGSRAWREAMRTALTEQYSAMADALACAAEVAEALEL